MQEVRVCSQNKICAFGVSSLIKKDIGTRRYHGINLVLNQQNKCSG